MIQKLEQYVIGANYGCGGASFSEVIDKVNEVIDYINSLPDENNPEPYNPVYDEDYLNEKIAKATKSWKGVDVDAMLAECRGYEEKPSENLEEAAYKYSFESRPSVYGQVDVIDAFKAGAEWQKSQMLKDAVQGEIGYWNQRGLSIRLDQSLEKLGYGEDTEVKIIIVKEDQE